jgi:hypothetical protein
MNKSQNDAILLAKKINEARELAERTNKFSYNWSPLVQLLGWLDEPQNIAEDLLYVYFEFTALLAEKGQDYGLVKERLSSSLYHLRTLYEALQGMNNKEEAVLQITTITDLQ